MSNIKIFSDGSYFKKDNVGGYSGLINYPDGSFSVVYGSCRNTSNDCMELTGALKAIEETSKNDNLIIVSDSKYVVNGINDWVNNWKENGWKTSSGKKVASDKLWKKISKLMEDRTIRAEWVRGHDGHPENELCDWFAKWAAKK